MVCLIGWVKSGPTGTQTCKHGRSPAQRTLPGLATELPVPALTRQAESLNAAIAPDAISIPML